MFNNSSETQIQNTLHNNQLANRASNSGMTDDEAQTFSMTQGPQPTFLTNEILVKSIHTSVSGSENVNNPSLANKLHAGYDTLSQTNEKLLGVRPRADAAQRYSANPRFARTGMSNYQSVGYRLVTGAGDGQNTYDSQNFFSKQMNQ